MKKDKPVKLIIPGNTNIPSLINSIIYATIQLRKNEWDKSTKVDKDEQRTDFTKGLVFNQIHIFNTKGSFDSLTNTTLNWIEELSKYEIY